LDNLVGIPNESGISILQSELRSKANKFFLIGAFDYNNSNLNSLLNNGAEIHYNDIKDYIYFTDDVESSYFDADGVLTLNILIPVPDNFQHFSYAVVIATDENKLVATVPTPKIQLVSGIGGSQVIKIGISGVAGQMNFKASDYITINEADELLITTEVVNLTFLSMMGKEMIKDTLKGVQ
jgi:hypothetical protein